MYFRDLVKNRILITGANGMLGQRTVDFYSHHKNFELLALSIENEPIFNSIEYVTCDITDRDNVKKIIFDFCPDFIVNAAAYTNVDKSETKREIAWKVNVKAVEYIAEAARAIDAHIIHISSDYIFDGEKGPYAENAVPNPLGYYGRTKLASENALRISGTIYTILRTNVLYGTKLNNNPDFVKWLVQALNKNEKINIVTDQFNNPTFIDDLVQVVSKVIEFDKTGLYHVGGREFLSRYDFALKIAECFQLDESLINPVSTEQLNQQARRPLKSGLVTLKAETELGFKAHSIEEALSEMKRELVL
jgi:dTDP-4-dehydrorhamnose reductase